MKTSGHAARTLALLLAFLLVVPASSATPRDPPDAFVTSFSLSATSFPTGGVLRVSANVTVPTGNLTGLSFGFYHLNASAAFAANASAFGGSGWYDATYAFTGNETPGVYELAWISTTSQNGTTAFSHQEYDNVTYPDGGRVRVTVGNVTPAGPDLVVGLLSVSPPFPREGENVTISGRVHNVGNGSAANSSVSVVLDGNLTLGIRTTGPLAPGANSSFNLTWTAVRGNHSVTAMADAFGEVAETSESNNKALRLVAVSGPGVPDLVAWIDPVWNTVEGQPVSIRGYVRNAGNVTVTNAYAELLLDGQLVASRSGSLAPGQVMMVSTWRNASVGFHAAYLEADPFGAVAEANESNNWAIEYFEVLPVVDVGIEILGVEHEPLRTEVGDAPHPQPRHIVTLRVTNHQNQTVFATVDLTVHASLRHASIATQANASWEFVALQPGESKVVELTWDPLAAFGDVTLVARIHPHGADVRWEDNEDSIRDFVLVGGLGGIVLA